MDMIFAKRFGRVWAIAEANPVGSSLASPKSRRAMAPSAITRRLPGWGSAWKNPCSKIIEA